jgi:hypothetical protein
VSLTRPKHSPPRSCSLTADARNIGESPMLRKWGPTFSATSGKLTESGLDPGLPTKYTESCRLLHRSSNEVASIENQLIDSIGRVVWGFRGLRELKTFNSRISGAKGRRERRL